MARKAAAPKPATDDAKPAEATRRSTRIAEKPAPPAPPAPTKKAAKPKPKRAAEKETEPEEGEPAAKKAKSDSNPDDPEDVAAPTSADGKVSKPSSKVAAKPASTTKPASSAKPASAAKPASRRSGRHAVPDIAEEEEKEVEQQMEIEDKENQKEEVKAAAAEAEAEVGELQIGDTLPDWTYKNEKDEDVEIAKLAGEKGLVLFLVPKADTPGCTTQACGFRDSHEEFEKLGYAVYCLSADKPAAQAKWQTKQNLQYSMLSDPKRKLIHALGAKTGTSTKRSHVVFEKGSGKLIEKKLGVKPADSPKQALEFVKKHHPNDA